MSETHISVFTLPSEGVSHSIMSDSLRPHGLPPIRLLCAWDFSGKNIGVGCHFLLQGICLSQGSNLGLLHCKQILYHLSYREAQERDTLLLINLCITKFRFYWLMKETSFDVLTNLVKCFLWQFWILNFLSDCSQSKLWVMLKF